MVLTTPSEVKNWLYSFRSHEKNILLHIRHYEENKANFGAPYSNKQIANLQYELLILHRDMDNNKALEYLGWTVLRFWGKEIEKKTNRCVEVIEKVIAQKKLGYDLDSEEFTYRIECECAEFSADDTE